MVEAIEVGDAALAAGGLGLAQQVDVQVLGAGLLAGREGDHVEFVFGPSCGVLDVGGADRAGVDADLRLGVVAYPVAGEFFEVRAEDLGVEGRGGGLPDLAALAAFEEVGVGDGDELVEADDGVGDGEGGLAQA
ncbi:hypothetical protein [Streptomyces sp. NBC_01518]|uniref:hypothetical protein n=1 Tax=Streptomyces sp. NBC_01518 TaxID=2903891 RepID=UPI0038661348